MFFRVSLQILPGLMMRSWIAQHSESAAYVSTHRACEGRQAPIAPLTKAWIVAAGTANGFGEKISQLESLINVRWTWICLKSHAKVRAGTGASKLNLFAGCDRR